MRSKTIIGVFVALIMVFILSTPVLANYSLNATDSGWYSPVHYPDNTNYMVGSYEIYRSGQRKEYRNFFVFNLSGVSENITSATLEIECPNAADTPDGTETWTLYDVSTPITTLVAGGTSSPIFDDLGSGITYGSATVGNGFSGTVSVNLSADAVAAINAAKGSSFAIGGAITTLGVGYDQMIFTATGDSTDVRRLTLVTTSSPEDMIQDIQTFFENELHSGLIPTGETTQSIEQQIIRVRKHLEIASFLIAEGRISGACAQIEYVYLRTDGDPKPKDYFIGGSTDEFASMLLLLMNTLQCE